LASPCTPLINLLHVIVFTKNPRRTADEHKPYRSVSTLDLFEKPSLPDFMRTNRSLVVSKKTLAGSLQTYSPAIRDEPRGMIMQV